MQKPRDQRRKGFGLRLPWWLGLGLRQFNRDRSGASALEFAIVATPFIFLLLAVLEVGLVFFANYSVESATAQAARMIRTGQVQSKGFDAAAFKAEVCKHLSVMLPCEKLKLDVRRFTNFSTTDLTNPLDANGNLKTSFSFDPGKAGDVVVVRAFYPWDVPASLPSLINLSNMKDNNRLLIATVAFRNEPF